MIKIDNLRTHCIARAYSTSRSCLLVKAPLGPPNLRVRYSQSEIKSLDIA